MRNKIDFLKKTTAGYPYLALLIFVIIVVAVSSAGYARYQHVQAEIAAQQTVAAKVQRTFTDWRDDLSLRLNDLQGGVQGTAQGASNVVGGAWGIISFLATAVLDFIGNLHIMIPVSIIYVGIGFFGTLKMRAATLIGILIACLVSLSTGIVPASVIGLLALAGLLLWNKINPRLLTAIQSLPAQLKSRLQPAPKDEDGASSPEPSA